MASKTLLISLMSTLMCGGAGASERLSCTPFALSVTTETGTLKLPSGSHPVKVNLIRNQLVFYSNDASTQSFACEREGDTSTCTQPGDVIEYRHSARLLFRTANYKPGQTIVAQFTCKPR